MQCFNVEFSLAALWRLSALNTQELHPHGLWRSSRFGEVFAQGPLSLCMCVTTESTTNAENLTTTSEAPGSCLCAHVTVYIVPFCGYIFSYVSTLLYVYMHQTCVWMHANRKWIGPRFVRLRFIHIFSYTCDENQLKISWQCTDLRLILTLKWSFPSYFRIRTNFHQTGCH